MTIGHERFYIVGSSCSIVARVAAFLWSLDDIDPDSNIIIDNEKDEDSDDDPDPFNFMEFTLEQIMSAIVSITYESPKSTHLSWHRNREKSNWLFSFRVLTTAANPSWIRWRKGARALVV